MKKYMVLLMLVCLALAFGGCRKDKEGTDTKQQNKETITSDEVKEETEEDKSDDTTATGDVEVHGELKASTGVATDTWTDSGNTGGADENAGNLDETKDDTNTSNEPTGDEKTPSEPADDEKEDSKSEWIGGDY